MIEIRKSNDTIELAIILGIAGVALLVPRYKKTFFDDIYEQDGKQFSLDPNMLRAIAKVESNHNQYAISQPNTNGTRDYGLMQINEKTAIKYNVSTEELLKPEVNIFIASQFLSDVRKELGNLFNAFSWISSYNQGVPNYKKYGIRNLTYVSNVMLHWQMYSLAHA